MTPMEVIHFNFDYNEVGRSLRSLLEIQADLKHCMQLACFILLNLTEL